MMPFFPPQGTLPEGEFMEGIQKDQIILDSNETWTLPSIVHRLQNTEQDERGLAAGNGGRGG